ncbi:hypothetical protein N7493_009771 [Penicillium malachiteum]|uniref:Aminoglycoside phosphotransferase domain-containing protein n=1 Tax=Penicillium malachiteum TaxID=1324776 RepID=A0AAD6HER0_9EURO|nr:hypothetical protein N7493_009771 [Penicillium malachiteum]
MQGVCSYTVVAGPGQSKIVQFRDENSAIDTNRLILAKTVHPEFVATCKDLGLIGDQRPLYVYVMNNCQGLLTSWRHPLIFEGSFFAQSWNNNQHPCSKDTAEWLTEFQANFDFLVQELPSRFTRAIDLVRKELPSLFSKALPFVLSHRDLNVMNILVNPGTGNITGIVDWAESRVLPFGFALYGLEILLSWMNSEGWHYYDHHRELESPFWQTFREEAQGFSNADLHSIRAARMAGLFYQYAFIFDAKGAVKNVLVSESNGSFPYLDAFCTTIDWSPIF